MEDSVLFKQRKKLIVIALFLVGVMLMIGGEDDPGMIGQVQDTALAGDELTSAPQVGSRTLSSPQMPEQLEETPELDAWYSQTASDGPAEPAPVNDDHLINDTTPMINAAPIPASGPPPAPLPELPNDGPAPQPIQ